ncbi:glycoside hydrolase family 10 protein [Streptomyces sp. NPDC088387]|uniref:glycoside hydrolase family 10 protein n=1 Tax=Streptomyces sp. NPDC088387 TaxID=3365859 RepID=UPI00381FAE0F
MGRLSRRAFALAALSTLVMGGDASAAAPLRRARAETGEMRGVWLATVTNRDWPSRTGLTAAQQRTELITHLDRAVRSGLNTVIFQVRPSADALWPSAYEPWSQYLTGTQGKNPGWDPLGTAVEEAHQRGLQLHAWFNPLRVALHTDPTRLVASHPARRNPDWVVAYGGKLFYNPGLPEVRAFVQEAMLDAVARYPVDAVHWDDYFYPYPQAGQTFDDDAAFDAYGGGFRTRADWRRDNINKLVREMAAGIERVRPGTQFGISPFGVWRNASTDPLGSDTRAMQAYDDIYADTRRWVKENWVDYICPQLYWHIGYEIADYAKLVAWWAGVAKGTGTRLYVGEALYKAGDPAQPAAWQDPAELSRHLTRAAQHAEVRGHVFFAAKEVGTDRIGAMARVVADHYGERAQAPR